MVSDTRVPSSSSSSSVGQVKLCVNVYFALCLLTDCDRLDPDTFLEMGIGRIVGLLGEEDFLAT